MEEVTVVAEFAKEIARKDDGFCVQSLKICNGEYSKLPKEIMREKGSNRQYIYISATGFYLPTASWVEAEYTGTFERSKYGLQFKVSGVKIIPPTEEKEIFSYLSSGTIRGIGKITASKIVGKFHDKSLEILENRPEELITIKGISEEKLEEIVSSYQANIRISEISVFLGGFGITIEKSTRIFNKLGRNAMQVIRENPYILTDVCGFLTAEKVAKHLCVGLHSENRIKQACHLFFLERVYPNGGLFCEIGELENAVLNLLRETEEVFPLEFENNFKKLVVANDFICHDKRYIFEGNGEIREDTVAEKISFLAGMETYKTVRTVEIRSSLTVWQTNNIVLSDEQVKAVLSALTNSVSVITGGAGTGKTTVLKALVGVAKDMDHDRDIVLLAPTGKRAMRLSEVTGQPATTVHKKLSIYEGDDMAVSVRKLPERSLIIIDERSMLDIWTARQLCRAIPDTAQVVFVGDTDQLPSVGAGNVLSDIIRSHAVPVTRLSIIKRQAESSNIVKNAIKINCGETDLEYGDDFVFIEGKTDKGTADKAIKAYLSEIDRVGIENVVLLSPMKRRGESSVNELNRIIQESINPAGGSPAYAVNNCTFRKGDRVIRTKNTRYVSNGDVGVIERIAYDEDPETEVRKVKVSIRFGENTLEYSKEDMKNISLAYALTIHKAQGSEYKSVILVMSPSLVPVMRKRNLLYTGVTRAKEKLIIVGDESVVRQSAFDTEVSGRKTMLARRIFAYNSKK